MQYTRQHNFTEGTVIDSEQVDSEFNAVQAVINGNIDVDNVKNTIALMCYPVGSIYISVDNTNPTSLFGGTWVAFGAGRTLVGIDATQTEFDVVEETGGHKLTQAHVHAQYVTANPGSGGPGNRQDYDLDTTGLTAYTQGINTGSYGGGNTENLQPYIVTYMFKRTA
jgi:hypothetical protein